jgi:hypothetical protein
MGLSLEYFSNHKAYYNKETYTERLVWRDPNTMIGFVKYLCDGCYLYVSGDLGDAIYKWNEQVTLEWIAGCNLQYFESKCVASEKENNYKEWKPEVAIKTFKDHYPNCESMLPEIKEAAENPYTFAEFLFNEFNEIELGGAGYVVALRCKLHLRGLKDAMKQLIQIHSLNG